MDKQTLLGIRQYFDMVHGVTIRTIGTFADEDLDFRPKPEARSIRELILHIYGMEKELAEGARNGSLTLEAESVGVPEREAAAPVLSGLTSIEKCKEYARNCHQAASEALAAMSEPQL